jgi:hypothetical protein
MYKIIIVSLMLSTNLWASGSNKIEEVIENYYQGYQKADISLIQKAFHPDTRLLSSSEGELDVTEMSDWLISLKERQLQGDIRTGFLKILSIDATNEAATVKLKILFPAYEFTDYLSLLKIKNKWIIVGKIYQFKEL